MSGVPMGVVGMAEVGMVEAEVLVGAQIIEDQVPYHETPHTVPTAPCRHKPIRTPRRSTRVSTRRPPPWL